MSFPKKGIWKWEDLFTLGFVWDVLDRSFYHYFCVFVCSISFRKKEPDPKLSWYPLIHYTTELCSLNFAVIKLLLPIYQYSQDSSTDFSNTSVKKKKFLTLNQNHNLVQPIASTFSCFVEIFCVTAYSKYRLSTLILIVSCVVGHMSNPLSHSAVW